MEYGIAALSNEEGLHAKSTLSHFLGEEMNFMIEDGKFQEAVEKGFEREELLEGIASRFGTTDYLDQQFGYHYSKMAFLLMKTGYRKMAEEYAAKFKARVEEILGGVYEVPEERIALEAAIFADKANITEELVRLGSHISQLRKFLQSDGREAIGKKIDFLIQEMNREANTIGSKSNDREITSSMLDLKAEIEKVREQVQNIE